MSENITHTAMADDGYRLAPHLGLPDDLLAAWDAHPDVARLGGITRFADTFSADLIRHAAQEAKKPEADRDRHATRKLAFVLGALTHRSIDRVMKPVFRYFTGKNADPSAPRPAWTDPVNVCTVYCDVFILKEVFGGGAEDPSDPSNPYPKKILDGPTHAARAGLESAWQSVWQRTLIRMHTFKPDREHIHEWMAAMFDGLQDFKLDVARYEKIALEWDPAMVKKYLVDTHYYDRADPIIAAARSIQRGSTLSASDVQEALDATTDESSRYARGLKLACDYLRAAGRLYDGSISYDDAKVAMDIGVPELSIGYAPPAGASA